MGEFARPFSCNAGVPAHSRKRIGGSEPEPILAGSIRAGQGNDGRGRLYKHHGPGESAAFPADAKPHEKVARKLIPAARGLRSFAARLRTCP